MCFNMMYIQNTFNIYRQTSNYILIGGDFIKNVLVDFRIDKIEELNLIKLGMEVIKSPPCNNLYSAICGHPDIAAHFLDQKNIVLHKNVDKNFLQLLQKKELNIFFSQKMLKKNYPDNIFLNAVNLNNFFIHNLTHTDKFLLDSVKEKKLINVKQGYTKCSTAIVSDRALITSDKGIATALENENMDVLLLPPGDILLPGLNYGFIGGTCGLISNTKLAFYGNLKYYLYGKEVINFLKKHDVEPVYLRDGKLIDRGSIFLF